MSGRSPQAKGPYNDDNPVIFACQPWLRPEPAAPKKARLSKAQTSKRREASLVMRLTAELMREQHNECYWCGCMMWHPRITTAVPPEEQVADSRATFDHKIPISRGGPTTKENGVAACCSCNNHRGDMAFEEYEQWPPN